MLSNQPLSDAKQQEFFDRARRGVLQFLVEKDGKLPLADMHEYSMNKFFIQHQAFSKLMESLVQSGWVQYDYGADEVTVTEAGKKLVA